MIVYFVGRICDGFWNQSYLMVHLLPLQLARVGSITTEINASSLSYYSFTDLRCDFYIQRMTYYSTVIRGYPFRGFKSIGLKLDICQTKLLNQFVSFQLKVWH